MRVALVVGVGGGGCVIIEVRCVIIEVCGGCLLNGCGRTRYLLNGMCLHVFGIAFANIDRLLLAVIHQKSMGRGCHHGDDRQA